MTGKTREGFPANFQAKFLHLNYHLVLCETVVDRPPEQRVRRPQRGLALAQEVDVVDDVGGVANSGIRVVEGHEELLAAAPHLHPSVLYAHVVQLDVPEIKDVNLSLFGISVICTV